MIVPTREATKPDLEPPLDPELPVGLGPVPVFVPVEEAPGPEGETAPLV